MLPKINRLKKQKDFKELWKKHRGFRVGLLLIKIAKNELPQSRFGFLVSLKVSKKAVTRNQIKRRLREVIRKHLPKIKPGYDIAISALPGAETKEFTEIEQTLEKLLKKAKIYA